MPPITVLKTTGVLQACAALIMAAILGAHATQGRAQSVEQSVNAQTVTFRPGLMRLDFSVTATTPTNWDGEIRLSRGIFDDLTPLGNSVTAPTDFKYADQSRNALALHTRAPSNFCGVEATIFSPNDARLDVKLVNRATGALVVAKTVFIDRLVDSATRIPIDENGAAVEITRAPADDLPTIVAKLDPNGASLQETTIFAPNETVRTLTAPRSCSARITEDVALVAYATKLGESEPFWRETRNVPAQTLRQIDAFAHDPNANINPFVFDLTAPQEEGVVELTLELHAKPSAKSTFALPTSAKPRAKILARRAVQFVVRSTARVVEPSASLEAIDADLRMELVETIDPTNSSWRKSFSKRGLLPFRKLTERAPNADKPGALLRSTFAAESEDANGLLQGLQPNYLEIRPSVSASDHAATAPTDDAIALGQAPSSENNGHFGVNLRAIVPKIDDEKRALEREDILFRRQFVQRWERDQFDRFLRNLDRSLWGLSVNLWDRPISSGRSRPFTQNELALFAPPQTKFMRLEPNGLELPANLEKSRAQIDAFMNGEQCERISWEAYPIPIQAPGQPHLLEIEYPKSFTQQLAVSILEPNQYGALMPSALDLGFVTEENALSDRAQKDVARYAALFWPQTKTPIILLANCSKKTACAYGQIRVYRANANGVVGSTPNRGRIFGLALTTPSLCDQFSSTRAPSYFGLNGAEDWRAFDQSVSRALYYLSANNFDAMTLAVVADGSALYPSVTLNPSPRYDGGVYLATGGDPTRKDVLAFLLARFESRNKSLVPMLKLNGTIPALERRLDAALAMRAQPEMRAALEGIEWIGPNGKRASDVRKGKDGAAQYYNVLHPEVEKVALALVSELMARCAPYDSFGGLALDLGADGWLALPDDVYMGMDDVTIARFVRESNLTTRLSGQSGRRVQELLLAKGEDRYRQRAEFIRDVCLNEWLAWRVDALYGFYRKVRETAAATRPDTRLYLLANNALEGPYCKATLYPSFSGGSRLREAFRLVGLDPARYATAPYKSNGSGISQVAYVSGAPINENYDSTIALLRPEIVAPTFPLAKTATTDQFASLEALALFSNGFAYPGAVFLHRAEKRPLYDFNATSPFRPTVSELQTRALPSGYDNRRRFARALVASDQFCFLDGGERPVFGEEDALREWIYVFKSLPATNFTNWSPNVADQTPRQDQENTKSAANAEPTNGANDDKTLQPIIARFYRSEKETWIYLLNVAPFHVGVKMTVKRRGDAKYETYTGLSVEQPTPLSNAIVWNYAATPYDLSAIRIEDPNASIETIEVTRPNEICGADGRLFHAVQGFVDRALVAKAGVEQPLRNGNFEESFTKREQNAEKDNANANAAKQDKNGLLGLEMPSIPLFKTPGKPEATPAAPEPRSSEYDLSQIPGWRAFGPNDVQVQLDSTVAREGRASLKISSSQNSGGVICQPFIAPTTGRLCIQALVGTRREAQALPLYVCLVGLRNGELFTRRVPLEKRILSEKEKALKDPNNLDQVVWVDAFALFDRLPLDGFQELSIRFELCGPGELWLDKIRLTKLAFAESEQPELMRMINTAEFRANKSRVVDVMFMLDGYWRRLLQEEIPDDSPLLANRPQRVEPVATNPEPNAPQDSKKGVFNRTLDRIRFW